MFSFHFTLREITTYSNLRLVRSRYRNKVEIHLRLWFSETYFRQPVFIFPATFRDRLLHVVDVFRSRQIKNFFRRRDFSETGLQHLRGNLIKARKRSFHGSGVRSAFESELPENPVRQ